jgi:NAD(P)H-nitrite reductase large subunit
MRSAGTVIVGNGLAAARLLQGMVARTSDELTVVGDEPHHAYNRLLLSTVLSGRQDAADLALRTPDWYARNGIRVVRGARLTDVDTDTRMLTAEDGSVLPYERLVLATGSRPNLPTLRGLVASRGGLLPGVYAFRTLQDCADIAAAARPGARAIVVGGGLLGLEAARGLTELGVTVEVVHQGPHLMERQLDGGGAAVLRATLQRHGITTYLDARAVAIIAGADGAVRGVRLADHFELACDLVVFACGVRPATALAQAGGLRVRHGVVVDDRLRTSAEGVWAVGDCAEHAGVVHGWAQAAVDQAEVLADVLAGDAKASYAGSRQVTRLRAAGVELVAMGETQAQPDARTEVLCLADPLRLTYRKTVARGGRLVGALLVGDTSAAGALSRAFDRGGPLPTDRSDLLFPVPPQLPEGRVA